MYLFSFTFMYVSFYKYTDRFEHQRQVRDNRLGADHLFRCKSVISIIYFFYNFYYAFIE